MNLLIKKPGTVGVCTTAWCHPRENFLTEFLQTYRHFLSSSGLLNQYRRLLPSDLQLLKHLFGADTIKLMAGTFKLQIFKYSNIFQNNKLQHHKTAPYWSTGGVLTNGGQPTRILTNRRMLNPAKICIYLQQQKIKKKS